MSAPKTLLRVEVSLEDRAQLEKFARFLRRRAERPDEPLFVTYGEIYGEVVFEDKSIEKKEESA